MSFNLDDLLCDSETTQFCEENKKLCFHKQIYDVNSLAVQGEFGNPFIFHWYVSEHSQILFGANNKNSQSCI